MKRVIAGTSRFQACNQITSRLLALILANLQGLDSKNQDSKGLQGRNIYTYTIGSQSLGNSQRDAIAAELRDLIGQGSRSPSSCQWVGTCVPQFFQPDRKASSHVQFLNPGAKVSLKQGQ